MRATFLKWLPVFLLSVPGSMLGSLSNCRQAGEWRVDFLYLHPSVSNDWAYVTLWDPAVDPDNNSGSVAYQQCVFGWDPGFELSFCQTIDCLDLKASYKWWESKMFAEVEGVVTSGFLATRLSLLEPFGEGRFSMEIESQVFDIACGRNYAFKNIPLKLSPYLGIKAALIKDKLYSTWINSLAINDSFFLGEENLSQTFKGVGPKICLDWESFLCSWGDINISILGSIESAYLWGFWKIEDKFVDSFATEISLNTSKRKLTSFVLSNSLGVSFSKAVCAERCFFKWGVEYASEGWFNHLQIFSNISGSQSNNLFVQSFNFYVAFVY